MPIYIYECDKCKKVMEVMQRITDPVMILHSDLTEGHSGEKEICVGNIKRIIQTPILKFNGKGWTRRFFR